MKNTLSCLSETKLESDEEEEENSQLHQSSNSFSQDNLSFVPKKTFEIAKTFPRCSAFICSCF